MTGDKSSAERVHYLDAGEMMQTEPDGSEKRFATYRLELTPRGESWIDWELFGWNMSGWEPCAELSGYVKWDGCLEFNSDMHICGPSGAKLAAQLLASVYFYAKPLLSNCDFADELDGSHLPEAPPVDMGEGQTYSVALGRAGS